MKAKGHGKGNFKGGKKYAPREVTSKNLVKEVTDLKKEIKKVQKEDAPLLKFYDDALQDPLFFDENYGTTGTPLSLTTTAQYKYFSIPAGSPVGRSSDMQAGVFEGQIVGSKMSVKYLQFRGNMYTTSNAITELTNTCRLVIFYDREFNIPFGTGSTQDPTVPNINYPGPATSVLADATYSLDTWTQGNTPGGNTIVSFLNGYNMLLVGGRDKRFEILFDKCYTFTAGGTQVHHINEKIDVHRIFDVLGEATDQGIVFKQNIGMLYLADSSVLPDPVLVMQWRISFTTP